MSQRVEYDQLHKYLVIGDWGVGRSSFLLRATDATFYEGCYTSIGVDFRIRKIDALGKTVKLQLWDAPPSGGSEKFPAIINAYFRGAHGVILMFDLSDLSTFRNLKKWLQDIDKYLSAEPPIIIIGSKSDLQVTRQVAHQEAIEFAESLGHS
jgi:Ras-related protein Rab-1A